MSDEIKELIRGHLDFGALVGETVQLDRSPTAGRSVPAFCPFHPNTETEAMAIYEDHAYCFVCQRSWDAFGWLMQRDRLTFPEALREAARRAGVTMPEWTPERQARAEARASRVDALTAAMDYYHRRLITVQLAAESALYYATGRGLSKRTIWSARLGYADNDLPGFLTMLDRREIPHQLAIEAGLLAKGKVGRIYLRFRNRLMIPFVCAGRCHFFTGRDLTNEARVKWMHLPVSDGDPRRPAYGPVGGTDPLVLVESPLCRLTLEQLGRRSVATLGTTLPDGIAGALRKHKPLYVLMDNDAAGRNGADRLGKALGASSLVATLAEKGDVNDLLALSGPQRAAQTIGECLAAAPTYVEHLARQLAAAPADERDQALDRFFQTVAGMDERDLLILKRRLVELSDLDAKTFNDLIKHFGREAKNNDGFEPTLDGRYGVVSGVICSLMGNSPTPLSNFSAQIERVMRLDDGEEISTEYVISGATATGRRLTTARVPAGEYADLRWLDQHWGVSAVVAAGQQKHVSTAIKLLSQGAPGEHVYTHTGWREVDGRRVYLHCGGAVGHPTQGAEIQVDLGPELDHYYLPDKPEDPVEAYRASLRFLDVADRAITLPIWAAMYHAPITEILPPRVVLWSYGPTNTKKSTLLILAMRHYGDFSTEGDTVSWTSTGNAMELLAFKCKDAPMLLDDFAHQPYHYQQKRMQQAAERIIRSTGNETGRMRMAKNTKLRRTYRIRSLILVTGETLPSVAPSAHSRILPLRFNGATVDLARLTAAQAEAGRYSHATTGYLLWLRDHWSELADKLPAMHLDLRAKAGSERTARLTDAITRNYIAARVGLNYGLSIGAVSKKKSAAILAEHWENLVRLAESQDRTRSNGSYHC